MDDGFGGSDVPEPADVRIIRSGLSLISLVLSGLKKITKRGAVSGFLSFAEQKDGDLSFSGNAGAVSEVGKVGQ